MTTEDKKEKQEIDALLSEAMNTLTFEERQEQLETLHGVDEDIAEEEDLIENALQDLDDHLLCQKGGSAYEIAEQMDPAYVNSRAFRIMFLRGNQYDTKISANQMLKFFEMKKQLFGNDKLAKDITIDDLDDDDREALKVGVVQIAGRDTSNRQIFVSLPGIRQFRRLLNEMRARFYTAMQALSSEQTQRKGAVSIYYTVGSFNDRSKRVGFFEIRRLKLSLPIHIAAIHFCLDDPKQYFLLKVGLPAISAKVHTRVRVHYGSHLECQYLLATFGISKEFLPLKGNDEADMHRHLTWVDSCLRGNQANVRANSAQKTAVVTKPTANDVLYRGAYKSNHAGNVHLRNLVAEWSQTYDSGTIDTKRRVVNEIIGEIHRSGGRFLSQGNDAESIWVTVPTDEVRSKITQMFRNRRRNRKKKS